MRTEHFPKTRKAKQHPAERYPWLVHYDLAYDFDSGRWTGYYRGYWRARTAIWWHRHIASWGGSADLVRRIP